MVKSEKIWNLMADSFDEGEKNFEPIHKRTVEKTKNYLDLNDVVLDYGCGTGSKSFEISGDVKEVLGIDISSKMLDIARRKAVEGKFENVDFKEATIFDERLKKESFDVIKAFNILHYLEDTQEVMERINELLKPGGFFISSTECMGEEKKLSRILTFSALFVLTKTGAVPVRYFKFSELENLITKGHFQILETEKMDLRALKFYFIVGKKV